MTDQTMPPLPDNAPSSRVRLPVRFRRGDGRTALFVDDLDVTQTVMGVDISLRPRGVAEIELKLVPGLFALDIDQAAVDVDAATRAVLLKLGWTPPTEGNPRD